MERADEIAARAALDGLFRYYEQTLVCFRVIDLPCMIAILDDRFCMVIYDEHGEVAWDLETGEVRTLT